MIAPLVADIPAEVDGFIAWFERLKEAGPGQGDPLFPWLADEASTEQMKWFLLAGGRGRGGFRRPAGVHAGQDAGQAKLEMARNFWDEMGRGRKGHDGPMLDVLLVFRAGADARTVVPESLALGNTMIALARHRRYAFIRSARWA